ncbi:MAG: 16S rRNA processing protein RimM [Actinobacteria bacterium]|nr:MAG: 16S rRNA processing protein RimM [Actinomycetota bacterium]
MRPHGIRGEVVVRSLSENPDRFQPGSRLLVGHDVDAAVEMVIGAVRPQRPGRLLVAFDGAPDRTAAEALRGRRIFARATALPELPDDVFWERDLVGLPVVDVEGAALGVISAVLSRTEQDLWEVQTPSGPVLLPAAKGIVVSVDLEGRRVTVDPPAGLFD